MAASKKFGENSVRPRAVEIIIEPRSGLWQSPYTRSDGSAEPASLSSPRSVSRREKGGSLLHREWQSIACCRSLWRMRLPGQIQESEFRSFRCRPISQCGALPVSDCQTPRAGSRGMSRRGILPKGRRLRGLPIGSRGDLVNHFSCGRIEKFVESGEAVAGGVVWGLLWSRM